MMIYLVVMGCSPVSGIKYGGGPGVTLTLEEPDGIGLAGTVVFPGISQADADALTTGEGSTDASSRLVSAVDLEQFELWARGDAGTVLDAGDLATELGSEVVLFEDLDFYRFDSTGAADYLGVNFDAVGADFEPELVDVSGDGTSGTIFGTLIFGRNGGEWWRQSATVSWEFTDTVGKRRRGSAPSGGGGYPGAAAQ